jgi:Domain of unknown function (DUF4192)
MGGMSSGAGAQGTKDGPLGVGPMPVLSEPLGSSISDHGSAGFAGCRDPVAGLVLHRRTTRCMRCPQICHWAHDLARRAQPDSMTSSKKTARSRRARRRRRRAPQVLPRLKIGKPDDLLAVIPYMLGFHPDESLVALFVKSGRVILTARMDLLPEASEQLAEQIDFVAKREGVQAIALVAYSADALPANRLLTRLMDRLAEHDLTDVLYVGHGRWWSLTCGEACCPLSGTPYDLTSHPLSAAAVVAGLSARPSRRELETSVGGPPRAEVPRLEAFAETLLRELEQLEGSAAAARLLGSLLDTAMADPNDLDERTCLLLGLLVTDLHLRDIAWALLSRATADDHVRLWGAVVARVPPILAAAPLCLLGMAAWVSGSGALLNCCCERLSHIDPEYSMGRLLADISAGAVSPSLWNQIGREIQAELRDELALLSN